MGGDSTCLGYMIPHDPDVEDYQTKFINLEGRGAVDEGGAPRLKNSIPRRRRATSSHAT